MVTVEKNGIKMTAKDKNQLAAFLNNGWKQVESGKSDSTKQPTSVNDGTGKENKAQK